MEATPIELIEAMYAARAAGDVETMMAYCADDIVFTFNADPVRPGSGDTLQGKAASLAHLARVRANWLELDHAVEPLREVEAPMWSAHAPGADGQPATIIRAQVRFTVRHRGSGQVLPMTKAQEWTVRDGRIIALTEFLDADAIAAFMRMAVWSLAEGDAAR